MDIHRDKDGDAVLPSRKQVVDYDVIVVGGGLVGCAAAVALLRHRCGGSNAPLSVRVYEQSAQLRRVGAAIGLYPNGLTALKYICPTLHNAVQTQAIRSRYFERRNLNDEVIQRTDVQEIQATSPLYYPWYKLHEGLVEALMEAAGDDAVLQWGHVFSSYEIQANGTVAVQFCKSADKHGQRATTTVTCRVLIGADGIYSAVRQQMQSTSLSTNTTTTLHSYDKVMYRAVLSFSDGGHQQNEKHNHTWSCPPAGTQVSYQGNEPGQSFSWRETLPGIVTITAAVVVKAENNDGGDKETVHLNRKQELQAHFSHYPAAVQRILQALSDDNIHASRVRDVEAVPKVWSDGPVVLMGDAAHCMTPYMGQGANVGLEDACVLTHELLPVLTTDHHATTSDTTINEKIAQALQDYTRQRYPRVAMVHAQSRRNALQSNTFTQSSAGTPFARRQYSVQFKTDLYEWKPPPSLS